MTDYSFGLLAAFLISLACGAALAIGGGPWGVSESMKLGFPHLVCALLWLPWSSRPAQIAGLLVALLLLFASVYCFLPTVLQPGNVSYHGAGMLDTAWTVFVSGAVVVCSAIAGLAISLNRNREQ